MTASWPADWAELKAGRNCPMCANQGQEDNGFGVRFLEGEYADVFLQRLDLCPGYSIAIWKHGHVAELTELSARALAGFTAETVRAGEALEDLFTPAKVNFETLGNSLPHLHYAHRAPVSRRSSSRQAVAERAWRRTTEQHRKNRLNQQLNDLRSLISGRAAAR